MRPAFDERDQSILLDRQAKLETYTGPRVGDYVVFADDTERRISHIWDWDTIRDDEPSIQTSDLTGICSGTYHLSSIGTCSFSGGLHSSVPRKTLTLTDETREGWIWFFHHNYATAHNGVEAKANFRVYRCTLNAPR